MQTITGKIKNGKIILDKPVPTQDGKVFITLIDEDEVSNFKLGSTGKDLQKLGLAGIWKDRGHKSSSEISKELRNKMESRLAS
ncbi:hypothetical protein [Leptospira sarikeiensis]|uniref:Uncharacterized protein n=1 Tax=Leptospira sarikeiensis TaxID=2484943 RepID=A0A4R9KER0_9LEPT|nr:hypothetical protein [Leptospira sarikeiensis]TGL64907.1 hypothetical protein EHQ64_01165 [Leptospira sarikeiensis]